MNKFELKDITLTFGYYVFNCPYNVLLISDTILGSYCNHPNGNHSIWFKDLISQILSNRIEFEISSFYGMASTYSNNPKMVFFIRFIGLQSLCLIPMEIFLIHKIPYLHLLLSYFIDPANCCFLDTANTGFQGEIFLRSFRYNDILNTHFNPMLYIITLYRRYIEIIVQTHHGEESGINLVKDSVKVLSNFIQDENELNSFDKTNKETILGYIKKLYKIINEEQVFKELYNKIQLLWTEIATELTTKKCI
jgi:hypothetical protein